MAAEFLSGDCKTKNYRIPDHTEDTFNEKHFAWFAVNECYILIQYNPDNGNLVKGSFPLYGNYNTLLFQAS